MRWKVERLTAAILLGLGTLQCAAESDGICDPVLLEAALAGAGPGGTVRVGACGIAGYFAVPAGVTLAGQGRGVSVVMTTGVAPAGEEPKPALRLMPGTPATRITDLSVESVGDTAGNSAIFVADGTGEVAIERVEVRATRGIGLAAEDVGSLVLTDVGFTGPVTEANQSGWPTDPLVTATHGVVLRLVDSAQFSNVTATGFAQFGALLIDSGTTWTGGGAPGNVGTGLMVDGGAATLTDLDVTGTMDGDHAMNAYGAFFSNGADVVTEGFDVSGGDDYGAVHDNASATHVNLAASDNGDVGVWVQNCRTSFEVSGPATVIERNRFGGIVAVASENVRLLDARIAGTIQWGHVVEETGSGMVGDGVQLVRTTIGVELRRLTLADNERAGLLLEMEGVTDTAGIVLEDIRVSSVTAGPNGAIAQNDSGLLPSGWEAGGVERDANTAGADARRAEILPNVPIVPSGELPANVGRSGINRIVDPDPPW